MNILVCGGAGYIGSHMVKMLTDVGHNVTIFDNLSTGHRQAVKWGGLVIGDLLDKSALRKLFADNSFDAVMHFSAKSLVGESVKEPSEYYRNNVVGTLHLLDAMCAAGINRFVFSSSAATFGNPLTDHIDESHPQNPINPYGETKLMVERILRDYFVAYGLRSVSLRYFNAAGADPSGQIGEAHYPETHLIPNVLKAALRPDNKLKVFGLNYPTSDGTCVRDYIHVNDLCRAHLLSLEYLDNREGAFGFNLGNGEGFSILDIIHAAEGVTGRVIPYEVCDRRPGDPPALVADATLANKELEWRPQYDDIATILQTAWDWHQMSSF